MPTAHVLFGTALPAQRRSRNARNAFPCLPRPRALSPTPAEVILAHLLWQEAPTHVLGIKHGRGGSLHPLAPRLGTWPRYSGWALRHSPCFRARRTSPRVSLECLFVPHLTARLKSSYRRQRERNILQVCNSLKHWTCSSMSLLLGRKEGRHVQTVVYSNTPVEFGSISTDKNSYFLGVLPVPRLKHINTR